MTELVTIAGVKTPRITHKDRPVCTTQQLAQFYGCTEKNIGDNYANNRDRFEEGKHFVFLEGEALKHFKQGIPDQIGDPLKFTARLMLWTELGSARHAKMLTTEKAWEVFEEMEGAYFRAKEVSTLPQPDKAKPARIRGRTPLDQVKVINFVGDALKDVPGIRLDVVAAAKLQAFEQHTGIDFSEFRRALPPVALERMVHLNPTQIGARIAEQTGRAKVSSQLVNKVLLQLGLQRKVEDGYALTEAGTKYGEVLPFKAKNAHHGNQIDWWESVVDVVRENMPAVDGKRGNGGSVVPLKPRQAPDEPQAALL